MLRYSLLFEGNNKGGFCLVTLQFLQYNHKPLLTNSLSQFTSLPFPTRSLSTLTQHLPSLVLPLWRTQRTSLSPFHITHGNFSFKLWWKLETTLVACSVVVKSSFLDYIFTRDWTLLVWRSVQETQLTPHRHVGHRLILVGMEQCIDFYSARRLELPSVRGLVHNTTCLLALAVMQTTAAGMKRAGACVQT